MPNTGRAVTFFRKKRITEVHFCRDYQKIICYCKKGCVEFTQPF